MSVSTWLPWTFSRSHALRGQHRSPASRPRKARLFLEHLEGRALLTSYSAANLTALIADINAANTAGGSNTISLTAATTSPYVLTAVNNTTTGANGLPVIAANDKLTIVGNGNTIERANSTRYAFRLRDVASGGSLTLKKLTLQGGYAWGSSSSGDVGPSPYGPGAGGGDEGGAIYNQGTLVLNGVTVQGNVAGQSYTAGRGTDAAGGGIYSLDGSVTLEGGTIIRNNEAEASNNYGTEGYGGNAYGGGLCAVGGTVTATNAILENNTAQSGISFRPPASNGYAYGAGLFASGATVKLTNCTVSGNTATVNSAYGSRYGSGGGDYGGGLFLFWGTTTLTQCTVEGNSATDGRFGPGKGGGIDIYSSYDITPGPVYLDGFTVAHVTGNTAFSGAAYDNIVGPYTLT